MGENVYQAPQVVTMTARELLGSLGHASASVYKKPYGDLGD